MTERSRRKFLGAATGSLAALALRTARAERQAMKDEHQAGIIDTHTHFYDPTRPEGVPWPGKEDALLYRRVLPDEYRLMAAPLGVTGTVVVEASPWLEDNQWLLDLAEREPFIRGIVGHLRPGEEGFAGHLRRFGSNPLFVGIRIGADTLQHGLRDPGTRDDLRRLAERDLALDVNGGPAILPDVARLAEACPSLRIVVNHVANVRIDGGPPDRAWRDGIRAAGAHPNVFCKVSALVEGTGRADGQAPAEVSFYRPVLDVVWNAFGEDRLLYGSNWPVSARFARYGVVQRIVSDYFQERGPDAAAKYFQENARRAYRYVKR